MCSRSVMRGKNHPRTPAWNSVWIPQRFPSFCYRRCLFLVLLCHCYLIVAIEVRVCKSVVCVSKIMNQRKQPEIRSTHDDGLGFTHITHWTWATIRCTQIWQSWNLSKAWSTMASIGLWNIWKFRCLKWYSRETHTIANASTTIWTDLVVSLRAQFENL